MFEYRGNRFELKEVNDWRSKGTEYKITGIEAETPELWLPGTYQGNAVVSWDMEMKTDRCKGSRAAIVGNPFEGDSETVIESVSKNGFSMVRVLHIPKEITTIRIRNDLFPNLERVEISPDNGTFSTDGRMIFAMDSKKYYGTKEKWLKYCPVCRGERIEIPEDVKGISEYAFAGTQYRTILFPETEPDIDPKAFDRSRWLTEHEGAATIGDMLYTITGDPQTLKIPGDVKRIHPELFKQKNHIKQIESPFLPNATTLSELNRAGCCNTFMITSPQANINIRALRKLESLEAISIVEGHKRYRTKDGVMFSADGRKLVYYPASKRDRCYVIPDGVQKIEESAFAEQDYLQEVIMPESVCSIGTRAFYACQGLRKIQFSPNIREIPDSNAYQKGGVFENCGALKQIELPENLTYLGSYAFYRSGLRSIQINAKLEQIGEYALMTQTLREISLPESVRRVGKGSLFYANHICAYEGSARGLIGAVNAAEPDLKDKSANVCWNRCEVTVLHRGSERRGDFLIPGSLARSATYHLDMAWNNDEIDYEEYDECLGKISNAQEKLEFARRGVGRHAPGEENVYTEYIRRVSCKIGVGLLEDGKEEEFLAFLKMGYLSAESLTKLVKVSNKCGMTVCSAYIMELQNQREKKTRGVPPVRRTGRFVTVGRLLG